MGDSSLTHGRKVSLAMADDDAKPFMGNNDINAPDLERVVRNRGPPIGTKEPSAEHVSMLADQYEWASEGANQTVSCLIER